MDIDEILKYLPHRYPFLLVDRILEVSEDGKRCRGLKNVSFNEPFFQGHFPGLPIMPGVLIVEAMAQVAAVIFLSRPDAAGKIPLLGGIENARFKKPVRPGDQLIIDCVVVWLRSDAGKLQALATVDGETVASMELTFKLRHGGS